VIVSLRVGDYLVGRTLTDDQALECEAELVALAKRLSFGGGFGLPAPKAKKRK
jgi:hypothetical protein